MEKCPNCGAFVRSSVTRIASAKFQLLVRIDLLRDRMSEEEFRLLENDILEIVDEGDHRRRYPHIE